LFGHIFAEEFENFSTKTANMNVKNFISFTNVKAHNELMSETSKTAKIIMGLNIGETIKFFTLM